MEDVLIKPSISKFLFIGQERSGKDLLILKNLYNLKKYGKSIFHDAMILKNQHLYINYDKIYFNGWLDKRIFPNYNRLRSIADIEECHHGFVWISDADLWFNSRLSMKNLGVADQMIMQLITTMGKRQCTCFFSGKRPKNLDIKIRTLCNFKVECEMICIKPEDEWKLKNWIIHYTVFDEDDNYIIDGIADKLDEVCNYYNTEEIIENIIKK